MFCPRCGQQAAEEIRFCPRCGLPLGAVAEVVETGGELARPGAGGGLTPRQRGTRKGLMITAGGVFFFAVAAFLTAVVRDELFPFLILAGLIITVGVMRTLYGLLLEENAPADKSLKRPAKGAAPTLEAGRAAAELPPARTVPISAYARPGAHTSDMAAPPPSVTENTTRLLDEEESGRR